MGIGFFNAVLLPPQVGILAVGRAEQEPVWTGSEFEPRLRMPLAINFDHRLIDGADGARALAWICETLEQPQPYMLEEFPEDRVRIGGLMVADGGSDLVVIGGGPGGYPGGLPRGRHGHEGHADRRRAEPPAASASTVAASPSKALLHVAAQLEEAKHAEEWGVSYGDPAIDLDKLRQWKQGVVNRLTGGLGQLTKQHGVEFVSGRARFNGPRSVEVTSSGGEPRTIGFEYAIVATGSVPATIPSLALDSPLVMDSTSALELERVPETLLVIGGGYIGLELGSVYAALGSRVTVVEMTNGLLPGVDRDLVRTLQRRLRRSFEAIRLETTVLSMEEAEGGVLARLGGSDGEPDGRAVRAGARRRWPPPQQRRSRPRADGRAAGRARLRRGRCAAPQRGPGDLRESATWPGSRCWRTRPRTRPAVAVEAIAGKPLPWDARAIPAVVYTDPEIAWVGLTETEAADQRIEVQTSTLPWAASGRATTLGRTDGATKLVVEPHTDRLLGVGIVGVGAGDLISEAALAIEMGGGGAGPRADVSTRTRTLGETLMNAAAAFYGRSPDYIGRRRGHGGG